MMLYYLPNGVFLQLEQYTVRHLNRKRKCVINLCEQSGKGKALVIKEIFLNFSRHSETTKERFYAHIHTQTRTPRASASQNRHR